MKFTTLIPTHRNDGSPVDPTERQAILQELWQRFGGATVEGTTEGYWTDEGTLYQDECLKVAVVCDNERYAEAEQVVKDIGKRLGQLAMYFEVEYFDGVRILNID